MGDLGNQASAKRIRSVTFAQNGEEWTATVGEQLRGKKRNKVRRNGIVTDIQEILYDTGIVREIVPIGNFWEIYHERDPGMVRSKWQNPFFMKDLLSIKFFET